MAFRAARLAACVFLFLSAPGLAPYRAAAQIVPGRAASASAIRPVAVVVPGLTQSPALLAAPPGLVSAAPLFAAPAFAAAPAAAVPAPAAALPAPVSAAAPAPSLPNRPTSRERLLSASRAPGLENVGRPGVSGEASAAAADAQFRALTGEELPPIRAAADGAGAARPSGLAPAAAPDAPQDPARAKSVRLMIAGTAAMKTGMETVTLSVPVLVLSGLGGASLVAGLVVVYGVAQAVFSGAAGGLIERFAPQKVLAGAVVAQAGLVAGLVGLGAAGLLGPAVLLPLYVLIGGAVGIMETARQSIPARLLGPDGPALARYNARLHIFYESAGVAGALAAGALMAAFGPLWALLIQPPAYLIGAWLFSRVRVPAEAPAAPPAESKTGGLRARAAEYLADVKAGARLVLGGGRLRWLALAFVLPQIVHRVFENLLLPVYAKSVLGQGGYSAYLLTASNMGELVGAALLLRLAAKIPAPVWVKRGGMGLVLAWALVFTHSLPLLLPLILAFSMTWSSSDLSLRAELQSSLSEKELPRATSFLYGTFVLGAAAASLALGAFLDALAPALALPWICGLFTALGVAVFFASRRLRAPKP